MSERYNPFSDWRHLCALVVMAVCVSVAMAFIHWPVLVKLFLTLMGCAVGASLITRQFMIRYGTWHGRPWPKWLVKR